jgi:hypothetical protein
MPGKTQSITAVAVTAAALVLLASCSPKPASLVIEPEKAVLDGSGSTLKLQAKVLDADGQPITEGVDVTWFSTDSGIFKLDQDGTVTARASGEGEVEVEVVGTELKTTVPVRVKIASSIVTSHEKSLSLWVGQVKDNVWAEVHSEKDAFVEGFKPTWSSSDSSIVKVENLVDARRQAWAKLTALKSGDTYITATFRDITYDIIVRVYSEDEEISLDGTRKKKEEPPPEDAKDK